MILFVYIKKGNFMCEIKEILDSVEEFNSFKLKYILKKCCYNVVVFGTGQLGKNIIEILRQDNINIICACDNDPNKWGATWEKTEILEPKKAVSLYGESALFIISIFDLFIWDLYEKKNILAPKNYLEKLGCKNVIYYSSLYWEYGRDKFTKGSPSDWILSPSEIKLEYSEILKSYNLFEEESKDLFLNILKSRLYHENGWSVQYCSELPHFDTLISENISEEEVFIDCGAFNGDTLEMFLKKTKNKFEKYFAIEPIEENVSAMQNNIKLLNDDIKNKINILQYAVGNKNEVLKFKNSGKSSRLTDEVDFTFVKSVKLDDLLSAEKPTWIKMDIEGAELNAIKGAAKAIKKYKPKLTICVYHRSSDLWKIPLEIKKICDDYKFYLRRVSGDIICYAII